MSKTIQGLPPGFRTVFVLRDVEGLSTEETAAALELSVPAVKSRLLRARLQLRERLGRFFQKRENGHGNAEHPKGEHVRGEHVDAEHGKGEDGNGGDGEQ